jgi:hypothetical protein
MNGIFRYLTESEVYFQNKKIYQLHENWYKNIEILEKCVYWFHIKYGYLLKYLNFQCRILDTTSIF